MAVVDGFEHEGAVGLLGEGEDGIQDGMHLGNLAGLPGADSVGDERRAKEEEGAVDNHVGGAEGAPNSRAWRKRSIIKARTRVSRLRMVRPSKGAWMPSRPV